MTKRRMSSTDYNLAQHFNTLRLIVQLEGFRPLCLKKKYRRPQQRIIKLLPIFHTCAQWWAPKAQKHRWAS
jgi:hypothetical protein